MLQYNASSPNVVNKSLTDVALATGVIKENTSIIDPVVLIDSTLASDILSKVNYAHIEAFNRWYYVTDITSVSDHLWEISMHVDVLYTYKDKIKEQRAVVSRQENQFNMLLDDGWFSCYQDPYIFHRKFSLPSPFTAEEFVLVVAGG